MANLFWTTPAGTKGLLSTPFKTEEEFERTVFNTSEILEDIFLLKRQIRGGGKSSIPDIVGVDTDGNVCIVEMKNTTVDSSIIPQVLQYALWAETHPDSIRSLWLECDNKPEDVNVSWEDLQVRILVIAPTILRSTIDLVDKINYSVEWIEVKRWVEGENTLLLVTKLEPEPKSKVKPVSGLLVYDEEFYTARFNKQSAKEFIKYARQLEQLVQHKEWDLEFKFNKNHCSFKAGFFNAFGIEWIGSKTFAFFVKLPEEEAKRFEIPMTRYEPEWKQAVYFITPGETKTSDYITLFEQAYRKLTGK
jgi:hypothetical protein